MECRRGETVGETENFPKPEWGPYPNDRGRGCHRMDVTDECMSPHRGSL